MKPDPFQRLHDLRDENDAHAAYMATNAERFDKLKTRHEDGTAPRAVAAFQLFQTPPDLAARMVDLAEASPGLNWLEPSAGLGRILSPISNTAPAAVTACEVSPDLAGELFKQFPDVTLWQGDFLDRTPPAQGFDRVVMNPPFHLRADIRHTLHALNFLRPGGLLVGLCMATRHRVEALQPLATHWEEIPAGTFRKEGTNVPTYLFTIRK